ncbi:hypothetical protein Q5O89_20880 [Peribacillus frigoritolerans]|nr:hypothetical protein [Peribacillus frigoritolerans]
MKDLSNKGIIVETNPSSNTAIANLGSIFDHYIQELNEMNISDEKNLMQVTINTDDPIIFNTNINNEFAYIFFALKEKGYPREKLLQWIDKVRENGMQSSFIESRDLSNEQRIKEVENIINELKFYI